MTNHTFKVITEQAKPYQGFPYVNPPVHDAPSVPSVNTNQPDPLRRRPAEQEAGPSRPVHLELNQIQTTTERGQAKVISQAEKEMRQNYGKESEQRQHQRYIETVTSPYVDETIFYDPFENRRIAHPKESPSASTPNKTLNTDGLQTPDDDDDSIVAAASPTSPGENIPYINPPSSALTAGSSGTSRTPLTPTPGTSSSASRDAPGSSYRDLASSEASSVYYSKESGVYGRIDPLPPTIPLDQFPEPPPAYTEIEEEPIPQEPTSIPVTTQPLPNHPEVITVPTPTVGQDPAALYNPSRKYVTCQFCRQPVLTIIKKEASSLTHSIACVNICFGMLPCAVCVYCTDCFKENRHYCPNCDLMVGREEVTCTGTVYKEEN